MIQRYKPLLLDLAIGAGVTAGGYFLRGAGCAILSLGSYIYQRKYGVQPKIEATRVNPLEVDPKSLSSSSSSVQLSPDARLWAPGVKPPKLGHLSNSCFLASMMQAIFLNEPTILAEIPEAIARRLVLDELFSEEIKKETGPKQTFLLNICNLLNNKAQKTKKDLADLRLQLQGLEKDDFPKGVNEKKAKELLTLLELYDLIDYCQSHDPVEGTRIHALRQALHRISPIRTDKMGEVVCGFSKNGSEKGDVHEALITLADLIFEGSSLNREMLKISYLQIPSGDQRVKPEPCNWGCFSLGLNPGRSMQDHLNLYLNEDNPGIDNVKTVKQQFKKAPLLLVLNLKRFGDGGAPILADEFLHLGKEFIRDEEAALYELQGVVRHQGAHYTAQVKCGGTYYHCDDISSGNSKIDNERFLKEANMGYILVYRKLG